MQTNTFKGKIPLLQNVLRVSTEPYTYLTDLDIHKFLVADPEEYFNFVLDALKNLTSEKNSIVLPPKEIFTDHCADGDFRIMPCISKINGQIVKTVKLVGTNIHQTCIPDQITVGKAFALHSTDNFITHIFDACLLSSARTGICASLAAKLLSNSPKQLSISGSGRVGFYSALYICQTSDIEKVFFHDPSPDRADNCAKLLTKMTSGVKCKSARSPFQDKSDIVIMATPSNFPICSPEDTDAPLIISLGADSDNQHELHPQWANKADIFVDTDNSLLYGDLKIWLKEGLVVSKNITDLISLIKNKKKQEEHRSVFISTGSALFDNLTIAYILQEHCNN